MEDNSQSTNMLKSSYSMKGGDGPNSYAHNSNYQRGMVEAAKAIIKEEITNKFDIQQLSSAAASGPIRIADFGCSSGPNTILAIQNIVDTIQHKFQIQIQIQGQGNNNIPTPEFQVFFNDQVSNDFNSLFALLPLERQYFAAGVPGSFRGRLFPNASLHFIYSSCALNWLSKVPDSILDKSNPAWNKGRIHHTGAPKEVFEAYSDQFRKDMNLFLEARAKEIAVGGLMALVIPANPDVMAYPQITTEWEFELLGSCLMDMAKMGIVSEMKIDTFNLPVYITTPEEVRQTIEGNGCFSIERMEALDFPKQHIALPNVRLRALYMRAALEALIEKHFGVEIIDQLFHIYSTKLSESPIILNPDDQKTTALFLLLKPKV